MRQEMASKTKHQELKFSQLDTRQNSLEQRFLQVEAKQLDPAKDHGTFKEIQF